MVHAPRRHDISGEFPYCLNIRSPARTPATNAHCERLIGSTPLRHSSVQSNAKPPIPPIYELGDQTFENRGGRVHWFGLVAKGLAIRIGRHKGSSRE